MTPAYHLRRIGCIVPSLNAVAEQDFIALSRGHASVHFARADVDQSLPVAEQFGQMVEAAPSLAVHLVKAEVEAVAFACTSASFYKGPGSDAAISEAISTIAGVPAICTASAVVDALKLFGADRIAVATPYFEWVWQAEREFLHAAGFEVVSIGGLEREGGGDINRLDPDTIRDLVRSHDHPEAEAMLVSCTDLPVLGLVPELEEDLGKPIVTSNQATYWAVSNIMDLGPVAGYGRLLELPRTPGI